MAIGQAAQLDGTRLPITALGAFENEFKLLFGSKVAKGIGSNGYDGFQNADGFAGISKIRFQTLCPTDGTDGVISSAESDPDPSVFLNIAAVKGEGFHQFELLPLLSGEQAAPTSTEVFYINGVSKLSGLPVTDGPNLPIYVRHRLLSVSCTFAELGTNWEVPRIGNLSAAASMTVTSYIGDEGSAYHLRQWPDGSTSLVFDYQSYMGIEIINSLTQPEENPIGLTLLGRFR